MNKKTPVRLAKVEPIVLVYDKEAVILLGALFILLLLVLAFNIGTENTNSLLIRCIWRSCYIC